MKSGKIFKGLLLIAVAAMVSTTLIAADLPDQWQTDFGKAKNLAKENDKPILAVFSAAWCGPCQYMVKSIYPKQEVKDYLDDWVPVYVDEADYPELTKKFGIRGFPTFVLLDSSGKETGRFVGGAQDASGFVQRIEDTAKMQDLMADVEEKLKKNPGDVEALVEKARLTANVDRGAAYEIYKKAYRVDSDKFMEAADPQTASYISSQVEFEDGIAKAEALVERKPNNPAAYLKRADIYLGDSFTKVLSYNPEHVAKAQTDLKKALELGLQGDKKSQAQETVAFLEAWMSDEKQAVSGLTQFSENYPESAHIPFAEYRLYAAAMEGEDKAQARKHLETAARTAPQGNFGDWLNARLAEMKVDEVIENLNVDAADLQVAEFIKGDPVKIEDGNVYVIEFWATWCPPCRASIPHLTELQEKYSDKKVTIIGISNEKVEKVKPFVEEKGDEMNYTVAVDDDRATSKGYMERFGARGIPHAFVVDREGKIVWRGHPMQDLDEVLALVVEGQFDPKAFMMNKELEKVKRQKLAEAYSNYFKNIDSKAEASEYGRYILENAGDDAGILNAFAWGILSDVPQEKRDVELAVKAAKKAVEIEPSAEIYDTYALACFQAGEVDDAVAYQSKAVDLTEKEELRAKFQATLEKYKAAESK